MAAFAPGVKAVFDRVVEIESSAERAVYLAEACADHPDIRQKVEALLRAYADAGSFLEPESAPADATAAFGSESADSPTATFGSPSALPTADHPSKDVHADAVIAGKYTLVEPIGEGGMGSVWRAKQTEPVKRYVAVKLIKAGMDSKQVLARFEAERQALAMMDHQNIAKVLDGGLHEQRPFFVMELVKGVPITDYCDHHKLTPQKRLELFVQVCQAIQHAHQKGIIPNCIESLFFEVNGPVEADRPFDGRVVIGEPLAPADDPPPEVGQFIEGVVGDGLPDQCPERFDRLQLRGTRRQEVQPHVCRHAPLLRPVPPGTIQHQHQHLVAIGIGVGGERLQCLGHALDLHPGEDHRERLAGGRAGEPVHVQPLVFGPPARPGSASLAPPHPAGNRLQSEPCLVLGPHLDDLSGVHRPQPPHPSP